VPNQLSETSEDIHLLTALNYYSRIRFILNLVPLVQNAHPSLRRIISVGGGGSEGPVDASDFPALQVAMPDLRGHITSMVTLGLEKIAGDAPNITLIHDHPGSVYTG
jgi:hypothetical protein